MSKQFTFNPQLDFAIERFIDAPSRLPSIGSWRT
jgi:hypothetical protein